jgi:F0F1-type ATP synthase assembly protein I
VSGNTGGTPKGAPENPNEGLSNGAWSIVSYILGGMLFYGGLGWLIDRWAGTDTLFLPIGLIVGVILSLWLVYLRFGRTPQ